MSDREKLISIRKSMKLTQKEMSELMGLSDSGYKKIEQGQRPVKKNTIKHAECLQKQFKNRYLKGKRWA